MNNKYYKLPLEATSFIKNKSIKVCNIEESIGNYIHLLMTTRFGECNFDTSFGCLVWNIDFNNISSNNKLKTVVADSLIKSLRRHEKRLSNIEVNVEIKQEEIDNSNKKSKIKKKVYIVVTGVVKMTNEAFNYKEFFYIAPLSY